MKNIVVKSVVATMLLAVSGIKVSAQDTDKVYDFVSIENPPTYSGGIDKLYRFINNQISYPKEAVKENVQGSVYLSFTVEKDGSLSDVKVDRKLGAGTDEEAVRVVKLTSKWQPGLLNGKPIRVKYNIPVKFKLVNTPPTSSTSQMHVGGIPASENDTTIYNFVAIENQPTFPGGMELFYRTLNERIQYPQLAFEDKIQGNVYLSFIVEKDGSISNVKVDKKLGSGTDEEAIRVIKLSEKWYPGIQNGKAVRVKYNLPVRFSLPK